MQSKFLANQASKNKWLALFYTLVQLHNKPVTTLRPIENGILCFLDP